MVKPHIPPDHTDPFLTTREAALLLGVTLRSVQLWVEAGTLQAGRTPGGHRRIRTSDVHTLAEKMGIKTAEPAANPLQTQLDDALRQLATQNTSIETLSAQLSDKKGEAERLLADWNALVDAIGSPTHGGAIGHARALRAEIERLRLQLPLICRDVEKLNMILCPEDWSDDDRLIDITERILARLDAIGVRSAGQEGGAA